MLDPQRGFAAGYHFLLVSNCTLWGSCSPESSGTGCTFYPHMGRLASSQGKQPWPRPFYLGRPLCRCLLLVPEAAWGSTRWFSPAGSPWETQQESSVLAGRVHQSVWSPCVSGDGKTLLNKVTSVLIGLVGERAILLYKRLVRSLNYKNTTWRW